MRTNCMHWSPVAAWAISGLLSRESSSPEKMKCRFLHKALDSGLISANWNG
ncbi:hypothetical protein ACPPVU_12755 [Mucilaginibacter sp. McL0603]|uniref:hypothetical protein n=1 Tax=Mucilaginibacter sp. McL0603 TaxID=3415670 RepID=UPI003CFA7F1D